MNFVPQAGFSDPVADSTKAFRALLSAMAHPGRLFDLPPCPSAPASLGPELGSILLGLADRDTPVWLAPSIPAPEAGAWLSFHAGALLTGVKQAAAFAALKSSDDMLPLDAFALGEAEYPDRSTTLLIAVEDLHEGEGLALRGPGIKNRNRLRVGGIGKEFWQARAELTPLYPLGIDMFLCAKGRVAALPRTTTVEA